MASTILIVEDEFAVARGIQYALQQEGYEVTVARSGEEGLEFATSQAPDLIVLDVRLPGIDGFEVLRRLRAVGSKAPVLFLTARGDEFDKVVGLELGADDYVTKPFSLRELQARVRAHLRRQDVGVAVTPRTTDVRLGNATVDLAGHRILRDGKVLPIKPKAFELLAFLVHHPGQVFSRDQLLEHVWGYDYSGETRTVDVHVHWLRGQLEVDAAHPRYLETVRGVGYVLRLEGD